MTSKNRSTTNINRITRRMFLVFGLAASLMLLAVGARARDGDGGGSNANSRKLEGTWVVRVRVADPPQGFPTPFTALETYSRGGGLVTSNDNLLIPRPGQGAWTKIGDDEYAATILFFIFDQTGAPAGTVKVTHNIRLEGEDKYRGAGTAEFKDLDGNPLFPDHPAPYDFRTRGQRLSPGA